MSVAPTLLAPSQSWSLTNWLCRGLTWEDTERFKSSEADLLITLSWECGCQYSNWTITLVTLPTPFSATPSLLFLTPLWSVAISLQRRQRRKSAAQCCKCPEIRHLELSSRVMLYIPSFLWPFFCWFIIIWSTWNGLKWVWNTSTMHARLSQVEK